MMVPSSFGTRSRCSIRHPTKVNRQHPPTDHHPPAKVTFCVQGAISPLLANRYMNRFLRHWRNQGRGEAFQAHVVNYADDFVILSRGHAEEALAWTRRVMTKLGLTVNEAKTTVPNARQERFDFLGYSFGPHHYRKDGHWYLGASPSQKSVQRLKARVGEIMVPSNVAPPDS
jgi:RNA-directed DNA polymerase